MMLSAGGAASCFSFHFPRRGFEGCARAEVTEVTKATEIASKVSVRRFMVTRIQSSAMRKVAVLLLALLALPATALATWSVIAVDRSTGRVVIASATCVNADDN